MKRILIALFIFIASNANAQTCLISFAGNGASETVESVKIENLTNGSSLVVNGNDILRLSKATGISSSEAKENSELIVFPNPMTDISTLRICPHEEGNAVITIVDLTGKQVIRFQSYLENFRQDFRLSGLRNGFYVINVKGNNFQLSEKFTSNGNSGKAIKIEKVNNYSPIVYEKASETGSKGTQTIVDMDFTYGDVLKLTGYSGIFSTVKTDIPEGNETVSFNFTECTDGDNNNYPVVEIGSQVWMAENLKTTKYNDGTPIPNITADAEWTAIYNNFTATGQKTPAYCWYGNSIENKAVYGGLYTWFTIDAASNGNKNACPAGWHVPLDDEWYTLALSLDVNALKVRDYGTVSFIAGGKLKETGTAHWESPNTGATNISGFTALPGGDRDFQQFCNIGYAGIWWTATDNSILTPFWRQLDWAINSLEKGYLEKAAGFSVRCVRN
jgi:uncharacterized protein (TIGR02145 family)